MADDKRLIEDYLPIREISAEASREKSVRKGHISTLHLWWARRPLVACRAAVYGALVPATQFQPENGPEEKRASLGRANAQKFITRLCKYPGDPEVIKRAQRHILEAHAARLTRELQEAAKRGERPKWAAEHGFTSDQVTADDIEAGRAPRPKVLDMFAGGGSIPLEALRLGCEAYALELNPVAHIIQLCTLVYPQKYGKPDPDARGMTGPPGPDAKPTWGGLAKEVEYWGKWVLEKVRAEIGDLYPPIPDPDAPKVRRELGNPQISLSAAGFEKPGQQKLATETPTGMLTPVAYLWTRTVTCKNPHCGATVPLVRQTWLCKKKDRYVALKMIAPKGEKQVRFEVVESSTEKGLGFDPAGFSKAGNATCPFCGTVADSDHVKAEGCTQRIGQQMMAIVCVRPGRQGKVYLSAGDTARCIPDGHVLEQRVDDMCARTGLNVPSEPMPPRGTLGFRVQPYGVRTWGDLFTPRQTLFLLTVAAAVRQAEEGTRPFGLEGKRVIAIVAYVGFLLDKISTRSNALCPWDCKKILTVQVFGRQALPMVWDFAESNPLAGASGSAKEALQGLVRAIEGCQNAGTAAEVRRGTAATLPWPEHLADAVVTDPPYYDNVPYADISDFFYVWLKRTIGHLYPEHFGSEGTPKKGEAVADATRHGGDKERAKYAYEAIMAQAFGEAHRVLKPCGTMVVVYAHKTTLGWATLVDALRRAKFTVTEAWPVDTEGYRLRALDSAALASSIFLVARKREEAGVGSHERDVRPELESIVRERVDTLWKMGISGADLVIAAVGAGLRAYTRFERVEYENGEEAPAEKFLAEVEGVVLDTLLERIFGMSKAAVSAVDAPTRFYVLWRFTYRQQEMDAGEVIVFAYPQGVELDGPRGLTQGARALLEKTKAKYRLRDYTERGNDEKLGLPAEDGSPAPLIDVLHRTLWLMENRPALLADYLDQAHPSTEPLRLVAHALAGPALEGSADLGIARNPEQSALRKLTTNWRSLIEDNLFRSSET